MNSFKISAILALSVLLLTNVLQAQNEIAHEHIAVHEHRGLSQQDKDNRLKHLKSFAQKGTRVYVQASCIDDERFKQVLLNEMGAKDIWRFVNTPQESDFILRAQAICRPHVQFTVYDMYFMVFDKDEHLLWKSDLYLGHKIWTTNNSALLQLSTRKYVTQSLIEDIRRLKSVHEETLDILGWHQVSETKFEAAEEWYWQGIDCFGQYNYKKAIDMFSKAISLNPYHAFAYKYRALAYYNISKFGDARNDIIKSMKLDPLCQQNDTIYHAVVVEKNDKFMRVWGPGGTMDRINNSLMAYSAALNSAAAQNSNGLGTAQAPNANTTSSSSSSGSTVGLRKVSCSFCNGTGMNPSQERPAFYNHSTEDYSSSMCNICGSSSNHYHKPCPSCAGKGYRETLGSK